MKLDETPRLCGLKIVMIKMIDKALLRLVTFPHLLTAEADIIFASLCMKYMQY